MEKPTLTTFTPANGQEESSTPLNRRWEPRDVIAAILLVGAFSLRALGINSFTEYIIIAVAVSYGFVAIGSHLHQNRRSKR